MSLQISVITAVKDNASTLGPTLGSLRSQSWGAVEHIVVDGVSTDGTLELIAAHRSQIAKFICEPDKGLYDALNKGIAASTGDVIGFMHADDLYESTTSLQSIAAAFEDPAVEVVYGDLVYVRRSDTRRVVRYWRAGTYDRGNLAHGWMPPHPTFYARRSVYSQFGTFDTRYRIAADYENMLRILWRGGVNACYIPEVLVRMRTGGMSSSFSNLMSKSREDYAAMQANGLGSLGSWQALLLKNVTKLPQFVLSPSAAH